MKQIHRYREQISGYQWKEGRGKRQWRGRGLGGRNFMYKVSYNNMSYNMGNIHNIL